MPLPHHTKTPPSDIGLTRFAMSYVFCRSELIFFRTARFVTLEPIIYSGKFFRTASDIDCRQLFKSTIRLSPIFSLTITVGTLTRPITNTTWSLSHQGPGLTKAFHDSPVRSAQAGCGPPKPATSRGGGTITTLADPLGQVSGGRQQVDMPSWCRRDAFVVLLAAKFFPTEISN